MQRQYFTISILTGILFVTALVGYLAPASSEVPPTRILLDNKGGNIIFTHASHAEREEQDCVTCHHTSGNDQTPPACTSCHAKKFDEVFVADHQESIKEKYCISCHHQEASIAKFSHDKHQTEYAEDDCQACHHEAEIEPEPQACSNCHKKNGTTDMLSLKKANHARCADCHEDMYDEGTKGCGNCHTHDSASTSEPETQSCANCHAEPVDIIVPTTTNAFHGQCMSCHEKQGKGPFGDDACYQCHMK
ncbi:MAG: cytochrome c3 family protein [Pseudodesulfovibrio sp.]|nr:cytochrome c3 family protein [Pseudodesulfovibrio sp.]